MPLSTLDFGQRNVGGVDSVCQELLRAIINDSADRYEYRVLVFDPTSESKYDGIPLQLADNISAIVTPINEKLGALPVPGIFSQLYRVRQQIKNFQPDIVHSHLLAWMIGVDRKYYRVATLHTYKWIGRKKLGLLNDFLYVTILPAIAKRFVDQFTCVGSTLKKALARDTAAPIVVIDNPLNDAFFNIKEFPPVYSGRLNIITCSSINPKKRIDRILLLMRKLRVHGIDTCLSVVGPVNKGAHYEQIKDIVCNQGLTSCVSFLGSKNAYEIAALFKSHHAGVFLSEEETFGLAPLEMLAANLPVIATPVGYIGENRHIFEKHGVLYFDGSITPVIEFLRDLESARRKIPYSFLMDKLSPVSILEKYEDLYAQA